jgi:hypothetical protein
MNQFIIEQQSPFSMDKTVDEIMKRMMVKLI